MSGRIKVSEQLRKAAGAEKSGDTDTARALYQGILDRFPANAKAKAALKRLPTIPAWAAIPSEIASSDQDVSIGLGQNLTGMADPLAVPASRTNTRGKSVAGVELQPGLDPVQQAANLGNSGGQAYERGDFALAIAYFRAAVDEDPTRADLWNDLGLCLNRLGRYRESAEAFQVSLECTSDVPGIHVNLANALIELGKYDEARAVYEAAMYVHPDSAMLLCGLADHFASTGKTKEAVTLLKQAVYSEPGYANTYARLADLNELSIEGPECRQLIRGLEKGVFSKEDHAVALFAKGKALADSKQFDASFEAFEQANFVLKPFRPFDISRETQIFEEIQARFRGNQVDRLLIPELQECPAIPVFVLGMPRCGSTLIEQILASHSKVHGAGEIGVLSPIVDTVLRENSGSGRLNKHALKTIRSAYFEEIGQLSNGASFVTDKTLPNFRNIGFILSAIPEAKVVHVHRDPIAVCWSIFRRSFSGDALNYAYDLEQIAEYYLLYHQMMRFWAEAFPNRIIEIGYEDFTKDPQSGIRNLLTRCGLEFEEAALNFHKSKRAALTSSMTQVRRKVYQGSSEEWRGYEAHLTGLVDALSGILSSR